MPPPPNFDLGTITAPIVIAIGRVVLILVDAMLLFGTVYAFFKGLAYRPHLDVNATPLKRVLTLRSVAFQERWRSILEKFQGASPESIRLAVIDADSLVDDALKQMGIPGDHMADRLSQFSPEEISSLNSVWRAHRYRNEIVHTPGFAVSPEDAQEALGQYEAFLKELNVLV